MYVSTYVCMYVHMYVRMYVRRCACIIIYHNGQQNYIRTCTFGQIKVWFIKGVVYLELRK